MTIKKHYKILSFIIFLISLLLITSCSKKPNSDINKPNLDNTKLYLINKFGKRYTVKEPQNGITNDFITMFADNKDLEIKSVLFLNDSKKIVKEIEKIQIRKVYYTKNYMFFEVIYLNLKRAEVSFLKIETNNGFYQTSFKTDLHEIPKGYTISEELTSSGYKHQLIDYLYYDVGKPPAKISSSIISMTDKDILIKDIELVIPKDFKGKINNSRYYLNGVLFDRSKKFLYNRNNYPNVYNLKLTYEADDYYLGDYVFKITCEIDNKEYILYTSSYVVTFNIYDYKYMEDNYKNRINKYIEGDSTTLINKLN